MFYISFMRKIILIIIAVLLISLMLSIYIARYLKLEISDITGRPQRDLTLQEDEENIENLLLPDLEISEPEELFIENVEGVRKIRFSTSVSNQGKGELKIRGDTNKENQITKATQIIREKDGNEIEREIGIFVFHPEHEHWHIERFTEFQLLSVDENGNIQDVIASTDKMSFCLWDEEKTGNAKNSPKERVFIGECEKEIQGISPGWSDTYGSSLPGQELDITNVEDGIYEVRATLNPDRKIIEEDYGNNSISLLVNIKDEEVIKQ